MLVWDEDFYTHVFDRGTGPPHSCRDVAHLFQAAVFQPLFSPPTPIFFHYPYPILPSIKKCGEHFVCLQFEGLGSFEGERLDDECADRLADQEKRSEEERQEKRGSGPAEETL